MGKVPSLKQLCLDVLHVPSALANSAEKSCAVPIFERNMSISTTIARFSLPVNCIQPRLKKRNTRLILSLGPNPVNNIWNWFILVFFHHIRKFRAPIILRGLRYGLLKPDSGLEIAEILQQSKGSQEYPHIVWLLHRDWDYVTPLSSKLLKWVCVSLCRLAQQQQQDAPCMVLWKYPLSQWCPVCIQRLFTYFATRDRHPQCCGNIHPDRWCPQCQRMRKDMSWASMVHLWPIDA